MATLAMVNRWRRNAMAAGGGRHIHGIGLIMMQVRSPMLVAVGISAV